MKIRTVKEWIDFYNNRDGFDKFNYAIALEQTFKHSIKEKYCAECGSTKNLIKRPACGWIKLEYYLCNDCNNYYNNK